MRCAARARLRARALAAGGLGGAALLAIAAAIALPSASPGNRAAASSRRPPPPPHSSTRIVAVAQRTLAAANQAESDPSIRRFTGRVGPDLSAALSAAGVPERQGREYVWLLGKAIRLADGLSVDDRFDLVVQRTRDGKLGQLLYAGMDRVARADVELMKWTDGRSVIWVNADGVGGEAARRCEMPVHGPGDLGLRRAFPPDPRL